MKVVLYVKKVVEKWFQKMTKEESMFEDMERNYSKYMVGYKKSYK